MPLFGQELLPRDVQRGVMLAAAFVAGPCALALLEIVVVQASSALAKLLNQINPALWGHLLVGVAVDQSLTGT